MAPNSSTLAWKIPWMEEPGGLQSMGLLRVGHNFTFTFHFHALEKEMATHSSVLAWRITSVFLANNNDAFMTLPHWLFCTTWSKTFKLRQKFKNISRGRKLERRPEEAVA